MLFTLFRSREDQATRLTPHELFYNRHSDRLPNVPVAKFDSTIVCGCTGPDGGITQLDLHSECIPPTKPVVGVGEWNISSFNCVYGMSLSLYEEDETTQIIGDPIADVYGAVVRRNNVVLAVADGVSWGKKPRLAARCAARAAIEHVSEHIDDINKVSMSSAIFDVLKKSLLASQECIMENRATLTTLSVVVVCPLAESSQCWGVFVASVGDSPVFVYSPNLNATIEMTIGSNPSNGIRDPKNSGGALGPAVGINPDLENLSFSFLPVLRDDVVLLMTDGVSDNLLNTERTESNTFNTAVSDNIAAVLNTHYNEEKEGMSAQSIAACLMNRVVEKTEERRQFNRHCIKKGIEVKVKAKEDKEFAEVVSNISGKLDHATVLTYQIGKT